MRPIGFLERTLKPSAKGKCIGNQSTKSSFKLTSAVIPESHRVASFMVFTFHPTKFSHLLGIYDRLLKSKQFHVTGTEKKLFMINFHLL